MTIKQTLTWATNKLNKPSPTPSLDAEVLLSFVLKKPKEFLYTQPEIKLTSTQQKKLTTLVNRRAKGEPVAYLTNHKEFYGLDFFVNKRVLVPRPETELLVEETLNILKAKSYSPRFAGEAGKLKSIADIGTGSGCIIITLAKIIPTTYNLLPTTYYATDISQQALQLAQKNAKAHKVKIKFLHGNLLEPFKSKKMDIIVANLPYLEEALPFEPKKAFVAGKHGLDLYKELFKQIIDYKLKTKFILIEIDPRQTSKIKKIIQQFFSMSEIELKKDLAGLDRVLIIKLKN